VTIAVGSMLIVYLVAVTVAHVWAHAGLAHRPCPSGDAVVLVDAKAHVLCLCRKGRAESAFRVALGRGGIDKRHEGDGRTPTGRYALRAPRPSSRYRLFIPVAFPTAAQAQAGYSGSDIGIHAPHLGFVWLRHATLWADWTRGCIAVGTWGEIERIAAWVRQHPAAEIVIE
jgi:hypothetical protein